MKSKCIYPFACIPIKNINSSINGNRICAQWPSIGAIGFPHIPSESRVIIFMELIGPFPPSVPVWICKVHSLSAIEVNHSILRYYSLGIIFVIIIFVYSSRLTQEWWTSMHHGLSPRMCHCKEHK